MFLHYVIICFLKKYLLKYINNLNFFTDDLKSVIQFDEKCIATTHFENLEKFIFYAIG